jgi:Rieske 2Fe-2S family protein
MELTPGNASATLDGQACGVPLGDLSEGDMRRAFYYTFFPNMMLSVHPDYVNYYTVWPVDATHSIVTTEWLQHPDSLGSESFTPKGAIDFWDTVNRQDWHICELSQLGVQSRAYVPGPFSPLESIPAAWDRAYLQALKIS